MNGFANHGLDEDAFGEKKGNIVQAFDAFRKSPCSRSLNREQLDCFFISRELIPLQPKQNPNM